MIKICIYNLPVQKLQITIYKKRRRISFINCLFLAPVSGFPFPTETFAISGTGAKTSFIYVQKKKHASEKQGPVFMGVAEHVGYLKKGKTEIPDPAGNDLVTIADIYTRGEQLSV